MRVCSFVLFFVVSFLLFGLFLWARRGIITKFMSTAMGVASELSIDGVPGGERGAQRVAALIKLK